MNKKITTLFAQMLFCASLYAQIPKEPINALSPNAAALGNYGDYAVSHFTGQPKIEIPLYTLQEKDITVPIVLNCSTAGFRPDMHPGWVGMGWSLNAGGVISRMINKWPDDYHMDSETNNANKVGYYFQHDWLDNPNWNTTTQVKYLAKGGDYPYSISYYDYEPDEFSFSFGNYSGNFYIAPNGSFQVRCDKPLKVTFNGQFLKDPFTEWSWTLKKERKPVCFSGFTVTTEDGTQYVFGGSTDAIEYSMEFFNQRNGYWAANSWYLTKVISNSGAEFNMKYERGDYVNQMYISAYEDGFGNHSNWDEPYYGKLISPVYLREIKSSQSTITFDRTNSTELRIPNDKYKGRFLNFWNVSSQGNRNDPLNFMPILQEDLRYKYPNCLNRLQWKQLDKINVKDIQGNLLKSFVLDYTKSDKERLKLLSVTELGKDPVESKKYSFEYNYSFEYYASDMTLLYDEPEYLSNKTDHWGFYNGFYANFMDRNLYFQTRSQPSDRYNPHGVLKKIIYPTGGVTEFKYDILSYSKQVQTDRSLPPQVLPSDYAGGLRIKEISSYDPKMPNQKNIKTYFYVTNYSNALLPENYVSSGVLSGQFQYEFSNYRMPTFEDPNVIFRQSLFSSQCLYPGTQSVPEKIVGYSEVTEKLSDGSYTRYLYSNYDNGRTDDPADNSLQSRTAYEPFAHRSQDRGKLLQEIKYSASDVPLCIRTIDYVAFNKENSSVKSFKGSRQERFLYDSGSGFFGVGGSVPYTILEGTAFKIYTYSYLPVKETTTLFDANGANGVTTTDILDYNKYKLLKSRETTDSRGIINKTTYKYPFDLVTFPTTEPSAFSKPFSHMLWKNMLAYPIETVTSKTINNVESVTSATLNTYAVFYLEDEDPVLLPSSAKTLTIPTPTPLNTFPYASISVASVNETLTADPRYFPAMSYDQYGVGGNILQTTMNGLKNTAYVWGYNNQYPVAQVANAKVKNIFYESFEEGNGNSPLQDDKTGRLSYMGTYNKTLNNVDAGNYTLSYWQKTAGVWVQVNIPITLSSTTYTITLNGQIDDICFYPADAQMTIYTYEPMVGMTSMTDPKGMTTSYEYDGFQRLRNVKDQNGNILKNIDYNYRTP